MSTSCWLCLHASSRSVKVDGKSEMRFFFLTKFVFTYVISSLQDYKYNLSYRVIQVHETCWIFIVPVNTVQYYTRDVVVYHTRWLGNIGENNKFTYTSSKKLYPTTHICVIVDAPRNITSSVIQRDIHITPVSEVIAKFSQNYHQIMLVHRN